MRAGRTGSEEPAEYRSIKATIRHTTRGKLVDQPSPSRKLRGLRERRTGSRRRFFRRAASIVGSRMALHLHEAYKKAENKPSFDRRHPATYMPRRTDRYACRPVRSEGTEHHKHTRLLRTEHCDVTSAKIISTSVPGRTILRCVAVEVQICRSTRSRAPCRMLVLAMLLALEELESRLNS
jgi:hypothetical protein